MLFIDADYPALFLLVRQMLGDDCSCVDLNQSGYADALWTGWDGSSHQCEVKQQGEAVGSVNNLEAQLLRQLPMAKFHNLLIYGVSSPASDGHVQTWKLSVGERPVWFMSKTYGQNYRGWRGKLARFSQLGIGVFEVPTIEAAAIQLVEMYQVSQTEGNTFNRLIPEKFYIHEENPQKRQTMLTLMSVPGIGEEVARALADYRPSVASIVVELGIDPDAATGNLAKIPLENGKRTIGPAAIHKLRKALGL